MTIPVPDQVDKIDGEPQDRRLRGAMFISCRAAIKGAIKGVRKIFACPCGRIGQYRDGSSMEFGTGPSRFWAGKTSVTFDDYQVFDGNWRDPLGACLHGFADGTMGGGRPSGSRGYGATGCNRLRGSGLRQVRMLGRTALGLESDAKAAQADRVDK